MVYITLIVEEDVASKIDYQYLMKRFAHVDTDAVIAIICTNEDWREERAWKYRGKQYYHIRVPYQQVKEAADARPILLEAVAKRLGVPVPAVRTPAKAA